MRTRIALVAIVPVAGIISTLALAASEQPARAVTTPSGSSGPAAAAMPADQLVAYQGIASDAPTSSASNLLLIADGALRSFVSTPPTAAIAARALVAAAAPAAAAVIAAPVAVAGPVDTVTPEQRAAWERVAMCEEGGNWAADGGYFSGGLGISRSNWYAYGGGAYAPSGAQATEDQQIMVAERIQSSPPDQGGCGSW